ncbi:MAG: hypothetical protein M3Q45_13155, partial [Chloroflexota bacterium]|nr:hypothetical protein [Chloroflexota bacterium]
DNTVNGTGFRQFALGDVNNDGDFEIIAVKGGSSDGKLIVYDPVIGPGQPVTAGRKTPTGIPWDKLYETPLPGKPVHVNAGNYDNNIAGDEIAYLFELNPADKKNSDDVQRMVIIKPTTATAGGRAWTTHAQKDFSNTWETMVSGNFDGAGTQEIVLVSVQEKGGELTVFRVDSGIADIGGKGGSLTKYWKHVAFGNWDGSGKPELLAVREGEGLASFFVFQYDGDNKEFKELYTEKFEPSPRFIFAANINANTEEEVFLLRNVSADLNLVRLIPRGERQDAIPTELEQKLDTDSGYRAGASGDIDGDGYDEPILIRDNKILIFQNANNSGISTPLNETTNRNSIAVGDLDKKGFASGPQFCANRSKLEERLPSGITGVVRTDLQLTNCGTGEPIPFTVSVDGAPAWLVVNGSSGQTPATLGYTFDAKTLGVGVYTAKIRIDSGAAVVNKPFLIDVQLTVTAAEVQPQPASLSFNYTNCITPTGFVTQTISMAGSPGVNYTAAIVDVPGLAAAQAALVEPINSGYLNEQGALVVRDAGGQEATVATALQEFVSASALQSIWPSGVAWLTASSKSDIIPDVLTLTADLSVAPNEEFKQAIVVIVADARAGVLPNNIRLIPVNTLCVRSQLKLPLISSPRAVTQ